MKQYRRHILIVPLLLLMLNTLHAQEVLTPDKGQLGFFIGSLRSPYSGIVSGIDFQSGGLLKTPFSIDARLQSRGTFLALNPQAFDLEFATLYQFAHGPVDIHGGLGYQFNGRFIKDERSSATSTYAPLARGKLDYALLPGPLDVNLRLELDISLFGDGLALGLRPQVILGYGPAFLSMEAQGDALIRLWGQGRIPQDMGLFMDTFFTLGLRF